MEVQISDKYYVDIDSFNHTLYRRKEFCVAKAKTSKSNVGDQLKKDRVLGYFPNMEQCIRHCVKDSMEEDNTEVSFDGYLVELERVNNALTARLG